MHMFNRMSYTLSYMPAEFDLLAVSAEVGQDAAHALFPSSAPIEEPIQPGNTPAMADLARRRLRARFNTDRRRRRADALGAIAESFLAAGPTGSTAASRVWKVSSGARRP